MKCCVVVFVLGSWDQKAICFVKIVLSADLVVSPSVSVPHITHNGCLFPGNFLFLFSQLFLYYLCLLLMDSYLFIFLSLSLIFPGQDDAEFDGDHNKVNFSIFKNFQNPLGFTYRLSICFSLLFSLCSIISLEDVLCFFHMICFQNSNFFLVLFSS